MADATGNPRALRVLFNVHDRALYEDAVQRAGPAINASFTLGGADPELEVIEWLRSDFGALEADDLRGYIASRDWPVAVVSDAYVYDDEPIAAVVLRIGGVAVLERDELLRRGDLAELFARLVALGN